MAGTNKMTLDGKDMQLEGLSVYIPETGRALRAQPGREPDQGRQGGGPAEILVKAD